MKQEEIEKAEDFINGIKRSQLLINNIDSMLSELKEKTCEVRIKTRWNNVDGAKYISSKLELKDGVIKLLEEEKARCIKRIENSQILFSES